MLLKVHKIHLFMQKCCMCSFSCCNYIISASKLIIVLFFHGILLHHAPVWLCMFYLYFLKTFYWMLWVRHQIRLYMRWKGCVCRPFLNSVFTSFSRLHAIIMYESDGYYQCFLFDFVKQLSSFDHCCLSHHWRWCFYSLSESRIQGMFSTDQCPRGHRQSFRFYMC